MTRKQYRKKTKKHWRDTPNNFSKAFVTKRVDSTPPEYTLTLFYFPVFLYADGDDHFISLFRPHQKKCRIKLDKGITIERDTEATTKIIFSFTYLRHSTVVDRFFRVCKLFRSIQLSVYKPNWMSDITRVDGTIYLPPHEEKQGKKIRGKKKVERYRILELQEQKREDVESYD